MQVGGKSLHEIDKGCIDSIIEAKEKENLKPATVNKHLGIISAILY